MRRPPAMFCRDCRADMGRGWQEAPLCDNCAPNRASACACSIEEPWEPDLCPVHPHHDPHDIPF